MKQKLRILGGSRAYMAPDGTWFHAVPVQLPRLLQEKLGIADNAGTILVEHKFDDEGNAQIKDHVRTGLLIANVELDFNVDTNLVGEWTKGLSRAELEAGHTLYKFNGVLVQGVSIEGITFRRDSLDVPAVQPVSEETYYVRKHNFNSKEQRSAYIKQLKKNSPSIKIGRQFFEDEWMYINGERTKFRTYGVFTRKDFTRTV